MRRIKITPFFIYAFTQLIHYKKTVLQLIMISNNQIKPLQHYTKIDYGMRLEDISFSILSLIMSKRT